MTSHRHLTVGALIALILGVSASRSAAEGFAAGDVVAANVGEAWFLATVDGRVGKKFAVTYGADESEVTLAAEKLRPLAAATELAVGDRVVAVWQKGSARMYPGTIRGGTRRSFEVVWDDGSAPSRVKRGKIAKLASAPLDFEVGDAVLVHWKKTAYYLVTLTAIGENEVTVTFSDGTKSQATIDDLRPIARARDLRVGDHVLAMARRDGKLYPAKIAERTAQAFTVEWGDGIRQSNTPAKHISKVRAGADLAKTSVARTVQVVPAATHDSREACVEFAYAGYLKSWSSADARTAAHRACDQIRDLASAKVLFGYYNKSWNGPDSMTIAAKQATDALVGKAAILDFAAGAYSRSWSGSDAANVAAMKTALIRASALSCLEAEHAAYSKSWSSSDAMNMAFEVCAK